MANDIEDARIAKDELKLFLDSNNVCYHYIGLDKNIADWGIRVGLDHSVDFSIVPDHVNSVSILKVYAEPVMQKQQNIR